MTAGNLRRGSHTQAATMVLQGQAQVQWDPDGLLPAPPPRTSACTACWTCGSGDGSDRAGREPSDTPSCLASTSPAPVEPGPARQEVRPAGPGCSWLELHESLMVCNLEQLLPTQEQQDGFPARPAERRGGLRNGVPTPPPPPAAELGSLAAREVRLGRTWLLRETQGS